MSVGAVETTRRAALGAMALAGLGFAVFGPRGSGPSIGNRLELQYWEKWTGHEGAVMQRIVDDFNQSQNRIFVRFFSMSGIDQKSLIAIAGGRPPDIIGLWNFNVPAYAEAGAIEPLDDFADRNDIRREDYVDGLWPLLTHRGKLYAMVSTCGSVAMFYNRRLFAEHGLDPDQPPRTIEELDDANRVLTRESSDGRLERVGFLHSHPGWWLWHWGYHFGGSLYDAQADVSLADAPENVRAYEWVRETADRLDARRADTFRAGLGAYSSAQNAFLQGKVAMVNQGPWLANVIDAFEPGMDYGVAPFPASADVYEPGAPYGLLDADVMVVPKGAKEPEASMEFIAFVQRPENIERLAAAHCKNSPLKNMPQRFYAQHKHRMIGVHDEIANSPNVYIFPRTRVWPQYVDAMHNAFWTTWLGRETPERALEIVRTSIQARLDDVAEKRILRDREGT